MAMAMAIAIAVEIVRNKKELTEEAWVVAVGRMMGGGAALSHLLGAELKRSDWQKISLPLRG